jgi:hypothetical protein
LKTNKLRWLTILLLALPAWAAQKPGVISGFVRNSAGSGQMGALVEIFGAATPTLEIFTDEHGFFSAKNLAAGSYRVRVTAASFLPSFRENVTLRAGASQMVNLTLRTLFEALQTLPRRTTQIEDDDWKWTLRSSCNRPILRVVNNGSSAPVSPQESDDRALKARVAFIAGSGADGFSGSNDMSTAFSVERSLFTSGVLSVNGDVGYGTGSPATVVRAAYSHTMENGSHPEVALTIRRFATPDNVMHNAALQALSLSASDTITLADALELNFGSEIQTVQFMGRVTAARPFGSADLHLSPDTIVRYQYATSEPNTRAQKGYDSAPADLSESGPRMSISGWKPTLERAHHHEVSVSHRIGDTNLQAAVFTDRIANTALTGIGDPSAEAGDVLPDVYSETFTYGGRQLNTTGMRLVVQQKLNSALTGTLDYAYGGVLTVPVNIAWQSLPAALRNQRRHALSVKMSGTAPLTKTRWIASYKWASGDSLTPVDMFNSSAGQADPYLNFFMRQPIPGASFMPGHFEALIEVRNLLAQGYLPVFGEDGRTLYLVQSPRAVRGGVAFSF